MRSRLILLCSLLVASIAALYMTYGVRRTPVDAEMAAARPAAVVDTFFHWRDVTTLADAQEMLRSSYRLAPDARFLRAFEELPRLAGRSDAGVCRATWQDPHWLIEVGADTVGMLPQWPRFQDAEALLLEWAKRQPVVAAGGRSLGTKQAFPANDLLGSLDILDRRWRTGVRDADLYSQASEALTWLQFLTTGDVTHHSTVIAARAMASIALARSAGSSTPWVRAMLARGMGYPSEAADLATPLAATDPIRAWVLGDSVTLFRDFSGQSNTRLLRLSLLAERDRFKEWLQLLCDQFPKETPPCEAALYTGLRFKRFDAGPAVAEVAFHVMAQETQRWTRADTAKVRVALDGKHRVASIERLVTVGQIKGGGPLLDATLIEGYERAVLYTSLTNWGEHLRRRLSSVTDSREFAERLGTPGAGPAGEYVRWYQNLVESTWPRSSESVPLAADIVQLREHGPGILLATYVAAGPELAQMKPAMVRAISRELDTRPEYRYWLATVVLTELHGLTLGEELLAATAPTGGEPGRTAALWVAFRRRDEPAMHASLMDTVTPSSTKTFFLEAIAEGNPRDPILDRVYARAIAAAPADHRLAEGWSDVLEKRGEYRRARAVLERWYDYADPGSDGFDQITVATREARLFRLEGLPERALLASERPAKSWKLSALMERARILDAVGQDSAAFEIITLAARRYPGTPSISALRAQIHWNHGRDEAAAAALEPEASASFEEWRWDIAPVFVERFKGRTDAAVVAAELVADHLGAARGRISMISEALAEAGDPETAFQVLQVSQTTGFDRSLNFARAYEYLADARGEDAAIEWLRTMRFPGELQQRLAVWTIATASHPRAAWLAPLSAEGSARDFDLLVRASAASELAESDAQRIEVASELHAREGTYYLTLARYALHGGDLAPVLALASDPKRRVEVYYWVGRRASVEGREADAALCYQIALETGASNQGEWIWAFHALTRLGKSERSLQVGGRSTRPKPPIS